MKSQEASPYPPPTCSSLTAHCKTSFTLFTSPSFYIGLFIHLYRQFSFSLFPPFLDDSPSSSFSFAGYSVYLLLYISFYTTTSSRFSLAGSRYFIDVIANEMSCNARGISFDENYTRKCIPFNVRQIKRGGTERSLNTSGIR